MLYLKELARNQQWKDSDMQGILQALGKSLTVSQDASGYNVSWKMLDACAKAKIVIVLSLGDPQFHQVRKRKHSETI